MNIGAPDPAKALSRLTTIRAELAAIGPFATGVI
jgi:hypothetical protein